MSDYNVDELIVKLQRSREQANINSIELIYKLLELSGQYFAEIKISSADDLDKTTEFSDKVATAFVNYFIDVSVGIELGYFEKLISYKFIWEVLFHCSKYETSACILNQRFNANSLKDISADAANVALLCYPFRPTELPFDFSCLQNKYPLAANLYLLIAFSRCDSWHFMPLHINSHLVDCFLNINLPKNIPISDELCELCTKIWFATSFGTGPRIKQVMNKLFQIIGQLLTQNSMATNYPKKSEDNKIIVVLEFDPLYSIMRHDCLIFFNALAKYFEITVLSPVSIDKSDLPMISSVINYTSMPLNTLMHVVQSISPKILFYFSIGIQQKTTFLSAMRLAPIQAYTLGIASSSYSPEMDFVLTEDGVVSDSGFYSEKVIALPSGTSTRLSIAKKLALSNDYQVKRIEKGHVRFVICAGYMKISESYLQVIQAIEKECVANNLTPEFHFFINTSNFSALVSRLVIYKYLPQAIIYERTTIEEFLQHLADCHLRLASFPCGGGNSTIDSIVAGTPSVALVGADCMQRSDYNIMQHFPHNDHLLADTEQGYIEKVMALVKNPDLLEKISIDIQQTMMESDYVLAEEPAGGGNTTLVEALHLLATVKLDKTKKIMSLAQLEELPVIKNM